MELLKLDGNVTLTSNYDVLKADLEASIKDKYNVVVTNDNVKESKVVMAQINKDKATISDKWKAFKKDLEAPIKDLDNKVKVLLKLFDDAREAISNQVNIFEAGIRENAQALCEDYAKELFVNKNIDKEVNYPSWNNLSFVTEQGKLSSAGKKVVELFVNDIEIEILKEKEALLLKKQEEEALKQKAIEEYKLALEAKAEAELKQIQEQAKVEQNNQVEQTEQKETPPLNDEVKNVVEPTKANKLKSKLVTITLKFKSNNSNEVIKEGILKELSDKLKATIDAIDIKDV